MIVIFLSMRGEPSVFLLCHLVLFPHFHLLDLTAAHHSFSFFHDCFWKGLSQLSFFFFLAALGLLCGGWGHLPSCSSHIGDLRSPTRDLTCVPYIGRWILNHWNTREVLPVVFIVCLTLNLWGIFLMMLFNLYMCFL